ncbi:MAG: glutamate--cysteine ligase [Simkaniaceae bacterium]|nr:glutamate--cysteine ligase [Simkaniaceae bacterium]
MQNLKTIIDRIDLALEVTCGLERETLRISKGGELSRKPHPEALGSPLTHSYFSTDFGEAQLEWNTPPLPSFAKAERFLRDLIAYTKIADPSELFWPYSMPSALKEPIAIARYGTSYTATDKELYRKGLCHRYGSKLQMISGIHVNLSFSSDFWHFFHSALRVKKGRRQCIDDGYFKMIRHFLREEWLLTYLFGASPAMHTSYTSAIPAGHRREEETIYFPHATSIRMSHLGYHSRIQEQINISFRDLPSYIEDMERALATPHPVYRKLGLTKRGNPIQMSDGLLQIENEYYGRIRPKRVPREGETPLAALKRGGVEYIELRTVDINPFKPLGIGRSHLLFLHQFLLYCLLKEEVPFTPKINRRYVANHRVTALKGRKKNLTLQGDRGQRVPLREKALKILREMAPLAVALDQAGGKGYEASLHEQKQKVLDPDTTPSSLILRKIRQEGFEEFALRRARSHMQHFATLSRARKRLFDKESERSITEKKRQEAETEVFLRGYEDLEISTQILVREALRRNITVEVVDRPGNVLRLKKRRREVYVVQATKTGRDSYVAATLVNNKHAVKTILREKGFSVPEGSLCTGISEPEADYATYRNKETVIKSNGTNAGVGVFFIPKESKERYLSALKAALTYDKAALIEERAPGEEYRFLVIEGRIEGIVLRRPAHVIGDGIHTVKELVEGKNGDPHRFRIPSTYLRLGKTEREMLRDQGLEPGSVPPAKKTVLLRHNSHVSSGGDAIDVTNTVHPSYGKIALAATKAIGMVICGADMLITSPNKPATQTNHTILELNDNPVLFIHTFPGEGQRRDVATPILRSLGLA